MKLEIGDKHHILVPANKKWVDTEIDIAPREVYMFRAEGKWKDWYNECDADGYKSHGAVSLVEKWRRVPNANWFKLIGALDYDESSYFPVGTGLEYRASRGGRLCCFANDLNCMYWNNHGALQLSVLRCM